MTALLDQPHHPLIPAFHEVKVTHLKTPSYPLSISLSKSQSSLALLSSNSNISLFSPQTLTQTTPSLSWTSMTNLSWDPYSDSLLYASSLNGSCGLFDFRLSNSKGPVQIFAPDSTRPPLLSLTVTSDGTHLIAGSELTSRMSLLQFWDGRVPSIPLFVDSQSHSDDITVLESHPMDPHLVVSGSTDALVNFHHLNQLSSMESGDLNAMNDSS